ncbi:MAG: 4-alpha-glucanotransferase [Lachnospiraceae bacterium]|nr:4-alpha-glucanotransferase [Lachnospiraceae bacterium]
MRTAGTLLSISSLPSEYGIGCFSKEAYEFVDQLKEASLSLWQVLPFGPTSYGDSPYSSFSTFAGNPYYIDPETLAEKGWLTKADLKKYDFGKKPRYIDFEKIFENRFSMLRKAFKKSGVEKTKAFKSFEKKNSFWLNDYALYMAVKNHNKNASWLLWDEDIRLRKREAVKEAKEKYAEDILFYKFQQFEFEEEWKKLKAYANKQGIKIVGDIPIYVALDSADAWSDPRLFQFDKNLKPEAVAGCPPDAFSATGQLWGNPLYDWEYHKSTGFKWWMRRLKRVFELYDVVRIDHFRGFDSYYSIPYGDKTAEHGHWEKGPGFALFDTMKKELGEKPVIAEDLGILTDSVRRLVKRTGYPGMKILEFAFSAGDDSDYLPHNGVKNSVIYTGTHDNDTCRGWYETLNPRDRRFAEKYLELKGVPGPEISWRFIRAAMMSVSDICIIPMQDFLGLGSEARMNTPSTLGNNWKWRMKKKEFSKAKRKRISEMVEVYRRG